jgi:hypothetical protein
VVAAFEDDALVRPDGLGIRRRRRALGLSRADLVALIERRSREATGRAESVSRNLLRGIEEENERVPYRALVLISLALGCNPVELLQDDPAGPTPSP